VPPHRAGPIAPGIHPCCTPRERGGCCDVITIQIKLTHRRTADDLYRKIYAIIAPLFIHRLLASAHRAPQAVGSGRGAVDCARNGRPTERDEGRRDSNSQDRNTTLGVRRPGDRARCPFLLAVSGSSPGEGAGRGVPSSSQSRVSHPEGKMAAGSASTTPMLVDPVAGRRCPVLLAVSGFSPGGPRRSQQSPTSEERSRSRQTGETGGSRAAMVTGSKASLNTRRVTRRDRADEGDPNSVA